jgi:pimeloyl-ACP methyl ester carboxylesterase
LTEITSYPQAVAFARARLAQAGLTRHVLDGTVYWSGGQGERTICLVHGANDHAGTWSAVAATLAESCRLIIPDLPGHGESEPASGPLGMPLLLARLAAILDHEHATRITLAGNSMGAWLAILYTLAHAERVARLVLESGGGLALPLGVSLIASSREEAITILRAVHGPNALLPEWSIDALVSRSNDSAMLRLLAGGLAAHFIDARLSAIDVPTTIVWGENDGVITRAYIDKLHAGLPAAKLCVIENAAHIPHLQQPERFIACL